MAKDEWTVVTPTQDVNSNDGEGEWTTVKPEKESPWQAFQRGIKSVNTNNLPRGRGLFGSFLAGATGETAKSVGAITELAGEATGSKDVQEFGRNVADTGKAVTDKAQEVSTPGAIAGQVYSYVNPVKVAQKGIQTVIGGAPKTLPGKVAEAATLGGGTTFLTTPGEAGDRVGEAITSGGISAAFPVLGKGLSIAGQKLFTPSAEAKYLYEKGITPTIGQALPWLKTAEDKASSLPLIGPQINKARLRGYEQFNKAVFDEVLDPLKSLKSTPKPVTGTALSTEVKPTPVTNFVKNSNLDNKIVSDVKTPDVTGREGFKQVKEQVTNAYNQVLPKLNFHADDTFNATVNKLEGMADGLPYELGRTFRNDIQEIVRKRLGPQGQMDGLAYKQVEEEIGNLAKKYSASTDPTQSRLGPAYQEIHKSLKEALRRQNPQYGKELDAINESFARYARLRATSSMANTETVFTPAQFSSAVRRADISAGRGKYASGEALMQELADKAKIVLPPTIPNPSGTAAHIAPLMTGFGLTSGVGLTAGLPAAMGALGTYGSMAVPYLKPVQEKIIKRLMADPTTRNLPKEEINKLARKIAITTLGVQGASEENPRVQIEKSHGGRVNPPVNQGALSSVNQGALPTVAHSRFNDGGLPIKGN